MICFERYRRREEVERRQYPGIEFEREDECGICMDMDSKIVLPDCNHAMCTKCYHEWYLKFVSSLFLFSIIWSWTLNN